MTSGCDARERLRESLRPATPHERYARSLLEAGLDSTALGLEWSAAAADWSSVPLVTLPFRETGYFAADKPRATGVRVMVKRGQRLVADVRTQGRLPHNVFVDLFRAAADPPGLPEHVTSAEDGSSRVEVEADRDAEFIIRVQPELLRGISYTLTVHAEPSLAFPVAGKDGRAIQSRFGVDRDAGRRLHKGVDIFASRGTPALAAVAGRVWAGTNELGGNVVFLWDERRNMNLYYAHLDAWLVHTGESVSVGDTIGLIGNTGNARGTAPHLHFGIYRRGEGAIDPYPFVNSTLGSAPPHTADTSVIGSWARVRRRASLLTTPGISREQNDTLARHTVVRIAAATGRWYRVILPDSRAGFVAADATESLSRPLRIQRVPIATTILDHPVAEAAVTRVLTGSAMLPVLGRFDQYVLVDDGQWGRGWVISAP